MELVNKKNNYNSFDVAKLVCSILVVMIHILPFGEQPNNNIFSNINFLLNKCLCRIAVPLFFVFNGYFLYKKCPLDKFSIEHSKKYVIRILKLYLLWSLIYLPLNLNDILNNSKGFIYGFVSYLKKLICVGGYFHLWYLNALALAVVVISFLLYHKWSPKKIMYLASAFFVIGLLGDSYYGIISPILNIPIIGKIIKMYFMVFDTTRNGLFFAFLFVALGMFLSNKEVLISRKKSLILFITSTLMLCVEVIMINCFNIAKDYNILLFAVPAVLFCFLYLKTIELKDNKIYAYMRKSSSLIFYGHPWVILVVLRGIQFAGVNVQNTPIPFLLVLGVTIFIAIIVIKISNKKHFRWLKKLY